MHFAANVIDVPVLTCIEPNTSAHMCALMAVQSFYNKYSLGLFTPSTDLLEAADCVGVGLYINCNTPYCVATAYENVDIDFVKAKVLQDTVVIVRVRHDAQDPHYVVIRGVDLQRYDDYAMLLVNDPQAQTLNGVYELAEHLFNTGNIECVLVNSTKLAYSAVQKRWQAALNHTYS